MFAGLKPGDDSSTLEPRLLSYQLAIVQVPIVSRYIGLFVFYDFFILYRLARIWTYLGYQVHWTGASVVNVLPKVKDITMVVTLGVQYEPH